MKLAEYNAGNASRRRFRRDLKRLLKDRALGESVRPLVLGLVEVNDRRADLRWAAEQFGYILFQYADAARGHCAILARADSQPTNLRHHKVNDRRFVGRDVAGAAGNGFTAEKHIVAIDVTGPREREVTAAVWHLVPSASHNEHASALLADQADAGAAWLKGQLLPTDLMGDMNGQIGRPEFARLRKVIAHAVGAPSRKGVPIDWHLLTEGYGTAEGLDGYSSDHRPVVAHVDWHRRDVA